MCKALLLSPFILSPLLRLSPLAMTTGRPDEASVTSDLRGWRNRPKEEEVADEPRQVSDASEADSATATVDAASLTSAGVVAAVAVAVVAAVAGAAPTGTGASAACGSAVLPAAVALDAIAAATASAGTVAGGEVPLPVTTNTPPWPPLGCSPVLLLDLERGPL